MDRRGWQNVAWGLTDKGAEWGLSLIAGVLIARLAGPETWGGLAMGGSAVAICLKMISGGIQGASTKRMACADASDLDFEEGSAEKVVTSRTYFWMAVLVASGFFMPAAAQWPTWLGIGSLWAGTWSVRAWRMQARWEKRQEAVADRGAQITHSTFKLGWLLLGWPGAGLALGQVAGDGVRAWLLGPKRRIWNEDICRTLREQGRILRPGVIGRWGLLIGAPLLAGWLWNDSTTSAQLVAWQKTAGLLMAPMVIYATSASVEIFKSIGTRRHLTQMAIAGAVCGTLWALGGEWATKTLFGAAYSGGNPLWLSPWVALSPLVIGMEVALLAKNKIQEASAAGILGGIGGATATGVMWWINQSGAESLSLGLSFGWITMVAMQLNTLRKQTEL